MKVKITWKDPDFAIKVEGEKGWKELSELPEEEQDRLIGLGVDEYVTISIDTITGDTRLVP